MEMVGLDVAFGMRLRFWVWVEIIGMNGSFGVRMQMLWVDCRILGSGWGFWG